jgi:hypothetical protein
MLEWFLQMITGPSWIFSHQEKFSRITPYGNRLCFRINCIKKEKINIKSEEPLKNLKTSRGSSPDLCLSNHPKMDPKYLVRQSLYIDRLLLVFPLHLKNSQAVLQTFL